MVEGQPRWVLREEALDKWGMSMLFDFYAKHPTFFSLKLHHGGALSKFPGRKYVGGTVTFVDQVNSDYFSVHEIDRMVVKLGYSAKDKMYYHFRKPGFDLDFGLLALGNDQDVLRMISLIGNERLIDVYIEHGITTVTNYFRSHIANNVVIEELEEEPVQRTVVKRKRRRRLYLEWKDTVIDANAENQGNNVDQFNDVDDGQSHVEAHIADDGQSNVGEEHVEKGNVGEGCVGEEHVSEGNVGEGSVGEGNFDDFNNVDDFYDFNDLDDGQSHSETLKDTNVEDDILDDVVFDQFFGEHVGDGESGRGNE